LKVYQYFDVMV